MVATRRPALVTEKIRNLVDSSFECRYDDLAAMLEKSVAAVALVEELREELPAELVVSAWTQHGNALRLTGRYDEAEGMLARAGAVPNAGPLSRVHLLEVQASLHRNTGRYESATGLLSSALDAQEAMENPDGAARLYVQLGIVRLDAGDRPRAVGCFQTALDLLTPEAPPDLLVAAGHNLFQTLIADGRLPAAEVALAALEPAYCRFTAPRLAARAEWLRARLYRATEQWTAARQAYERAYGLLSAGPLSPELARLAHEMANLISPSPGRA